MSDPGTPPRPPRTGRSRVFHTLAVTLAIVAGVVALLIGACFVLLATQSSH